MNRIGTRGVHLRKRALKFPAVTAERVIVGKTEGIQDLGLFGYKKLLHPVRTTRRAVTRPLTPKPARKALRAGMTVRHPASSLEGAAKASASRALSSGGRRGKGGGGAGLLATLLALGAVVMVFVAPGVTVMMLVTGHYFMATLGSEFWQAAAIAVVWWLAVAASIGARSRPFTALIMGVSAVVALIAFSDASHVSPARAAAPASARTSTGSVESSRAPSWAAGCRLYMPSANVRVAVSQQQRCGNVTRHLAAWTGERWTHRFHSSDDTVTSACDLQKGALRVHVFDSGLRVYGDEACSALRHHGFVRLRG